MDLLAGATFAWCAVYAVLAVYFGLLTGSTQLDRRIDTNVKASNDELLQARLFALGCLCFACYAFCNARHFHASDVPADAALWAWRAWSFAPPAAAAILHVVVLYAEVGEARRRWIVPTTYAVAASLTVANVAGLFVDGSRLRIRAVGFGAFRYIDASYALRWAFVLFESFLFVVVAAVVLLVVRAYLDGKREALAASIGGFVILGCLINDLLVANDVHRAIYLSEHGFFVFAFGLSNTLLGRHARLSEELSRKGSELRRRARALRRAYEELRAAQEEMVRREQLAVVGELAAVVSHEVRNPLAIIGNAVASLRKAGTSAADREVLLSILDEETARLNLIVSDLLRYARPLNVERRKLDLEALVARACDLVQGHPRVRLDRASAVGNVDAPMLPEVHGDPNLMRQVLDNLVQNACQAMPNGGTLTVRIEVAEENGASGVAISFADTGEGMDTQVRSRARTPFFTTRAEGTGLGLAICDRIVTAHGGVLSITSRSGEGTIVSVFLPAGRLSEVPSPSRAPARAQETGAASPARLRPSLFDPPPASAGAPESSASRDGGGRGDRGDGSRDGSRDGSNDGPPSSLAGDRLVK